MTARMKMIGALIAAIVLLEILANLYFARESRRFHDRSIEAVRTAHELEREIGFGGLIHNFKNAVLRPDEPEYLAAASRNAADALALASDLEAAAASLGVPVALPEIRSMIATYHDRLAPLRRLGAADIDARALDRRIRVSDSAALGEIEQLIDRIDRRVNARLEELSLFETGIKALGLFAIGASVLWLAILGLRHIRGQNIEAMKAANVRLETANRKLNRANTALQHYAGIAAHDLRAPARKMALFAHQIKADRDDPDAVARHAAAIMRGAEKMCRLVESLLDFSQLGFRPARRERVDMTALVREIVADVTRDDPVGRARIEIDPLPDAFVDRELISRAISNLIDNSLKYAREDRPAEIRLRGVDHGDEVVYEVVDNGIGVEPVFADRIFEPLQRLHSDSSRYPGVGIGLSLVRAIVEAHGGRAWLDVTHADGARFCFSIPRGEPTEQALAA